MKKRVEWITHKRKKILFADYSDLKEKEVLQVYKSVKKESLAHAAKTKKPLLMISNTADVQITSVAQEGYRELRLATRDIPIYSAIIGASLRVEVIVAVLSIYQRRVHFARTLEAAKEWLVNQNE